MLLLILGIEVFLWQSSSRVSEQVYPELQELAEIKSNTASFSVLSGYFTKLAQAKGGAYAFKVLREAPMPPNIDLHLLAHVVGDVLYKQTGVEGIRVCTNDFRNACSHSIVVGLFFDKGEDALEEIAEACRKAPGGSGAYTMCFHGLGHGIVAYAGYNLEQGIGLCEKTGTPAYHNREAIECIGGTIMELISGGFHDRIAWVSQRKKYFSADDPLSPCNKDFMPEHAQAQCYTYLTPYLWEAVGANMGSPTAEDFERSFRFCDKLDKAKEVGNRDACFGGFGKEFVVLVQGRDIRMGNIEAITDGQLRQIYAWCVLAHEARGTAACSEQALASLYWGGENDRSIAIRYCSLINDTADQRNCFENLIGAVSFYITDVNYRQAFCKEVPQDYQRACEARLLPMPL